jgi:hypothetical protein
MGAQTRSNSRKILEEPGRSRTTVPRWDRRLQTSIPFSRVPDGVPRTLRSTRRKRFSVRRKRISPPRDQPRPRGAASPPETKAVKGSSISAGRCSSDGAANSVPPVGKRGHAGKPWLSEIRSTRVDRPFSVTPSAMSQGSNSSSRIPADALRTSPLPPGVSSAPRCPPRPLTAVGGPSSEVPVIAAQVGSMARRLVGRVSRVHRPSRKIRVPGEGVQVSPMNAESRFTEKDALSGRPSQPVPAPDHPSAKGSPAPTQFTGPFRARALWVLRRNSTPPRTSCWSSPRLKVGAV